MFFFFFKKFCGKMPLMMMTFKRHRHHGWGHALVLLTLVALSSSLRGAAAAVASAGNGTTAAGAGSDDCADIDVKVSFPRHRDGQVVHARLAVFDVASGELGAVEGSSSDDDVVEASSTLCLPRERGYLLVASGNATRGSSFGRFHVTVTNREYGDMEVFTAGSEWARGTDYSSSSSSSSNTTTTTTTSAAAVAPAAQDDVLEDEGGTI